MTSAMYIFIVRFVHIYIYFSNISFRNRRFFCSKKLNSEKIKYKIELKIKNLRILRFINRSTKFWKLAAWKN